MLSDTPDSATTDALLAALAWQIELGVDECIGDAPGNRFEEAASAAPAGSPPASAPRRSTPPPSAPPSTARSPAAAPNVARGFDTKSAAPAAPPMDDGQADEAGVTAARALAASAATLPALHEAMASFDGCALKQGAKSTVFADGHPAARVMFIGEAPGRDEDREGKPFIGRSGQLLDRMLAAIGLDRRSEDPAKAAYLTNVTPWRPLGDRDPSTDEALMMWAFLERHIELAAPEFVVTLGKISAGTLLETPVRITRERGRWVRPARAAGRPMLMTFHPAYLLRQSNEKAKSWRDLLSLRAALDGAAPVID